MPYQTSFKLGPSKTPFIIKTILILTLAISLISAILTPFIKTNFIQYIFSLSLPGIKSYFFWQLITYTLLQLGYGIAISFIIGLLFNLYLIWVMGSQVVEKTSNKQFFIFYLLSSIFSAFVILLTMLIGYQNYLFSSSTITLYAVLIAWMMLMPSDTKIFLFFALPIKHYYLVLGLICLNLLSTLSSMDLIGFFGYLSVSIFAYFYSVIIFQRYSPFHVLNKMERSLIFTTRIFISKFRKK
ncbi:MAG TPA: rhomboid family intramembrane serine protease [Chlamydiae bacterium]|nr:rhomboid family intramembrane serine protease [Chlamydiota bacterium]